MNEGAKWLLAGESLNNKSDEQLAADRFLKRFGYGHKNKRPAGINLPGGVKSTVLSRKSKVDFFLP